MILELSKVHKMEVSELLHNYDEFPAECAARLVEIIKEGTAKDDLFELIQCVASLVGWLANVVGGEEKPIIGSEDDCDECGAILELCDVAGVEVPAAGFGGEFLKNLLVQALLSIVDNLLDELQNDGDSEVWAAVYELLRVVLFQLGDILEKLDA